MGLTPDRFELVGRTRQNGCPVAYVGREFMRGQERVLTVYKLIKRRGNWYNCGQWISQGRFRITDDPSSDRTRALRLSDNRIDRSLQEIVETA